MSNNFTAYFVCETNPSDNCEKKFKTFGDAAEWMNDKVLTNCGNTFNIIITDGNPDGLILECRSTYIQKSKVNF